MQMCNFYVKRKARKHIKCSSEIIGLKIPGCNDGETVTGDIRMLLVAEPFSSGWFYFEKNIYSSKEGINNRVKTILCKNGNVPILV